MTTINLNLKRRVPHLSAQQIRAARGLVGWTQKDLAAKCGLSSAAIANIEAERNRPSEKNMASIFHSLDEAGVEFIDGGVKERDKRIRLIDGYNVQDVYIQILDDVLQTLQPGDEALFFFIDETISSPSVVEKKQSLRDAGIRLRALVEEGTTFTTGKKKEYRTIPKKFYKNSASVVYGPKVAMGLHDAKFSGLIIREKSVADVMRLNFEFIWGHGSKLGTA